jgi:hypothetical protein
MIPSTSSAIHAHYGKRNTGGGRYAFASWEEAPDLLFTAVAGKLIVIDEFPYLSKASPALPSIVQRALEPRGIARRSGSRLLPSGSATAVIGRLLSGTPAYRREFVASDVPSGPDDFDSWVPHSEAAPAAGGVVGGRVLRGGELSGTALP